LIPLQFGLLGLGVGGLYALIALGIVLVYRGSGVINFAQGAIGMAATYLYWSLHENDHVVFVEAFAISMLASLAFGVAIQLLIMRPLRGQSPLTRMLATLGILVTLTSAVTLKWPQAVQDLQSSLPTGSIRFGSIALGQDEVWIFGIVVAASAVLYGVYRYSKFGLATTAVTENPIAAATLGFSPDLIASVNWALGCALATLAGILLAPITGLSVQGLTLLSIPAFAAVVVGNFRSFPITVGAGLALGVIQSEMSSYVSATTGWSEAVPFFIVLIVLAVRGRTLMGKAERAIRLPRAGTGRIRPWAVGLFAGICLLGIETLSFNWVAGITTTLAVALVVLSLVVVTGYAGQLSLAQLALAGIGAWAAARCIAVDGLPFWLAVILGVAAAFPVGLLVGLPALRTRGVNLAIATLGLSVAAYYLIFTNSSLSGGNVGFDVGNPSIFGIDLSPVVDPRPYAIFSLILFLLAAVAVANLRRGRTGRRLLAVRSNERAAASLGVGVMSSKLYAFGLASMIAALGGILEVFVNPNITFTAFDPISSITYVGYAVIGGIGYVSGPLFGAALSPGSVGSNITEWFSSSVQNYLTLASGAILILILVFNANGIAHVEALRWRKIFAAARRHLPRPLETGMERLQRWAIVAQVASSPQDLASSPRAGSVARGGVKRRTLRTDGLSVTLGGVRALVAVSVEMAAGEVLGLIGPNGAGKTTFIDAVTGFNRPSRGEVLLDGVPVTSLPPRRRAALGLGRSFQTLELFEDMTVAENLLVASEDRSWHHRVTDLFHPGKPRLGAAAIASLVQLGLTAHINDMPGDLPYGTRCLVAIARALAAEPSFLFLDEPAAGLSEAERAELSSLIRRLVEDVGIGVILVEHDMDFVMRTCDRIVALEFGHVIAQGTPSQIRKDPLVIRAYLGADLEEVHESPAASSTRTEENSPQ
jgi:ABC-type branched-subunit amino acid transport system ATPase component/branched-subunit amino acid ABC-type transport system permease component